MADKFFKTPTLEELRHLGIMQEFKVEYNGATVGVQIEAFSATTQVEPGYPVSLLINGLRRESGYLNPAQGLIRLSSPVQTDYEWHEIIEATFQLNADAVTLTLTANQQPLASKTFLP